MEAQTIINILGGVCITALGWFASELWAAVKELKSDLAKLREHIPEKYIDKDEFRDGVKELKDLLKAISTKLDTKQDK